MKTKNLKSLAVLITMLSANYLSAQDYDPNKPPNGQSDPCIPSASAWFQGGNNIIAPAGWNPNAQCLTCVQPVFDAGTCNNFPFILKANNLQSVFIQPSGNIGINVANPAAALDIMSATSGNQARFKIFGNQNGDVESTTDINMNFNTGNLFNINEGPVGSSTSRFTLLSGGNVGIGVTNPNAKLVVNDRTSNVNGIGVWAGATSAYAFGIFNNAGANRYLIYPDGKTHISDNTQIGFYQTVGMADALARLNVDASGGTLNGVKVSTNNGTQKMFYVENSGITNFEVLGDGTTHIGTGRPLSSGVAANAKLTVDGMILAKDVRVAISTTTHWADFVFEKNYKLTSLNEIETYITANKHLPGVPSEAEVKKDGVDLMDMNVQLLQKVEELYLYTINLQKQNNKLEKQIEKLSSDVKAVSK